MRFPLLFLLSSLLLVAMAICIFVSTRLMKEPFQLKWYDMALTVAGVLLAYISLRVHMAGGVFRETATPPPSICGWKSHSPPCCFIARFTSTAMLFAGIPLPSGRSHLRWPCGAALMGAGQLSHRSSMWWGSWEVPGTDSPDAAGAGDGDGAV